MKTFRLVSFVVAMSVLYVNSIFSQEWFEKSTIGVNYTFGNCHNIINEHTGTFSINMYYAFNKSMSSDFSKTKLRAGSDLRSFEVFKTFAEQRIKIGLAYISRKADPFISQSPPINVYPSGDWIYYGSFSYEDKWIFVKTRGAFEIFNGENAGRLTCGLNFDIGYSISNSRLKWANYRYHPGDQGNRYDNDSGEFIYSKRMGAILALDLQYDVPKIPISFGVRGNLGAMGGSTVAAPWNKWTYYRYTNTYLTGTNTDENIGTTGEFTGSIFLNLLYYAQISIPLE
jgi:hypothetical protein